MINRESVLKLVEDWINISTKNNFWDIDELHKNLEDLLINSFDNCIDIKQKEELTSTEKGKETK